MLTMLGPHTMQNQQRSASGVKEEDQRVDSDVIKRPVESTTKDALSCEQQQQQQQQKREESPASDKAPKTAKAPPPISSSSDAAKKKATEEIDIDDDVALTFPQRLMEILDNEENSEIISWLPHGRGFVIYRKKAFEKRVLPKYFNKQSKYSSFTRKLNRWGFCRVTRGAESGAYYHRLFVKGGHRLIQQMSCQSSSSHSPAKAGKEGPAAVGSKGKLHVTGTASSKHVPSVVHIGDAASASELAAAAAAGIPSASSFYPNIALQAMAAEQALMKQQFIQQHHDSQLLQQHHQQQLLQQQLYQQEILRRAGMPPTIQQPQTGFSFVEQQQLAFPPSQQTAAYLPGTAAGLPFSSQFQQQPVGSIFSPTNQQLMGAGANPSGLVGVSGAPGGVDMMMMFGNQQQPGSDGNIGSP